MYSKEKIKSDLPILPIGAISQTLNIHQRTLRIYDKEGILCPKRTSKNRRTIKIWTITKWIRNNSKCFKWYDYDEYVRRKLKWQFI